MKISIITVCYNSVDSIEETVLSVINQSYQDIEYIIIDGGSTDGTVDIIKKYSDRITYWISEPDKGIYDAMNKGIIAATGEWIHFRNSGDLFYDNDTLNRIFSQPIDDDIILLHGDSLFKTKKGYITFKPSLLKHSYKKCMPVIHPSTFVKTNYHKSNLFNIKYRSSSDYNFIYNLFENNHPVRYIPETISIYDSVDGYSKKHWAMAIREIWSWKYGNSICNNILMELHIVYIGLKKIILFMGEKLMII